MADVFMPIRRRLWDCEIGGFIAVCYEDVIVWESMLLWYAKKRKEQSCFAKKRRARKG